MLLLVFPHRNQISVVEKDVCCHQYGVVQQSHGDVVPLFQRFLLELDHALKPVQRRDAVQQPAKLSMGADLALDEDRCLIGINATGEIQRRSGAGIGR